MTDMDNPTEKEFLLREYGINLRYCKDPSTLSPKPGVIVSAFPEKWKSYLSRCKDSSQIFFLIGNETYEPDRYIFFNNCSAVSCVFIYNPPYRSSYYRSVLSLVGNILDGGWRPNEGNGSLYRDFLTSLRTKQKKDMIKLNFDWYELPQGYCNSFVSQLRVVSSELNVLLENGTSLYNKAVRSFMQSLCIKTEKFSYIGQKGNHRRETCLAIAQKQYGIVVHSTIGFGGANFNGDTTYLNLMIRTKFPLVPPGFFNNRNHRYTESLLTFGLPAILAQNSLDSGTSSNWTEGLNFPSSHSYSKLLNHLNQMSNEEFDARFRSAFQLDWSATVKSVQAFNQRVNALGLLV